MKIDDQEIENLNISVILEKLKELPPSLPELAEINKSKNIALSEKDMELWQKRDDVLDLLLVERRSQSEIFNEARQLETLYNKLIECTKQNVVFTTETNCLAINQSHAILCLVELKNYMGKAYNSIKEYTKAIKSYQEAIDLSLEYPQNLLHKFQTDIDHIFDALIKCYENSGTLDTFIQESVKKLETICTSQEELKIRYCLGAAAYAKKDYNAIIENYNRILFLKPNLSDTEALAVGQAEVGFSSVQKIGTYSLRQCVAIIIHDPFAKETALVHFDRYTSSAAVDKVLNRFKSSETLNVYLIGARDDCTNDDCTNNVEKIISILQKYNCINIKLADLGDLGYEELVFDPRTAKITPAFPRAVDPSMSSRIVMLHLNQSLLGDSQNLYLAFDLTNYFTFPSIIDFAPQEIKSIMIDYIINYSVGIKNGILLTDIAKNRQAFAEVLGNKILKDNEQLTLDFIQLRVRKILQEDTTCNKKLVDDITNRATTEKVYPPSNQEEFLQLDVIIQQEIDQVNLLEHTSADSLDLVS